jgi:hypothetical protein
LVQGRDCGRRVIFFFFFFLEAIDGEAGEEGGKEGLYITSRRAVCSVGSKHVEHQEAKGDNDESRPLSKGHRSIDHLAIAQSPALYRLSSPV